MFQSFAGALGNTVGCVFGDPSFYAGATKDELGQIAQKRRAARHDDAVVDDVGSKLWWRILKHFFHCIDHTAQFLPYRTHYFIRANFNRARKTGQIIATFDHHRKLLLDGHRGADMNFHFLSHFVADGEVVGLFHVIRGRVVDGIARAFDRRGRNDATKRYDRDVGRPTADVDELQEDVEEISEDVEEMSEEEASEVVLEEQQQAEQKKALNVIQGDLRKLMEDIERLKSDRV